MNERNAKALKYVNDLLDAGFIKFKLPEDIYARGLYRSAAQFVGRKRRYTVTATMDNGATYICFAPMPPAEKSTRVVAKSAHRTAIENLASGASATFPVAKSSDISNIRGAVQKAQIDLKHRYATMVASDHSSITVTRIDGAESGAAITSLRQKKKRQSRWPFARLGVGQSELVRSPNIESARVLASRYKRDYGGNFTVNKTSEGVLITRTE